MPNRGHIQRRGLNSFRLKFETGPRDPVTGKRQTAFETVKADSAKEAQRLLTQRLASLDTGDFVISNRLTVAEHVWRGLPMPIFRQRPASATISSAGSNSFRASASYASRM